MKESPQKRSPERRCRHCKYAEHPDRPATTVFCTKFKKIREKNLICASFVLREPPIASLVEPPKPKPQKYLSPQQRKRGSGTIKTSDWHCRCETCTYSRCNLPKSTGKTITQDFFCKLQDNDKVHKNGLCELYDKVNFPAPILRGDVIDGPGGAA